MKAFVTGSRVYGKPHSNSDIDLVIRADIDTLGYLDERARIELESDSSYEGVDSVSLKFGKLNLLVCLTDECYNTWVKGTEDLKKYAPVTREVAVEHFALLRKGVESENHNKSLGE